MPRPRTAARVNDEIVDLMLKRTRYRGNSPIEVARWFEIHNQIGILIEEAKTLEAAEKRK